MNNRFIAMSISGAVLLLPIAILSATTDFLPDWINWLFSPSGGIFLIPILWFVAPILMQLMRVEPRLDLTVDGHYIIGLGLVLIMIALLMSWMT